MLLHVAPLGFKGLITHFCFVFIRRWSREVFSFSVLYARGFTRHICRRKGSLGSSNMYRLRTSFHDFTCPVSTRVSVNK